MKVKTKEALIDLVKESERNAQGRFIRIFPSALMNKYESVL